MFTIWLRPNALTTRIAQPIQIGVLVSIELVNILCIGGKLYLFCYGIQYPSHIPYFKLTFSVSLWW